MAMSILWTLSAFVLYSEIASILVLLLPFISNASWKKIMNSRMAKKISLKSNFIFKFCVLVLSILMLDAIRQLDMWKYGLMIDSEPAMLIPGLNQQVETAREYRAERNVYISSMGLFLGFVLNRLLTMISRTADLEEEIVRVKEEYNTTREELDLLLETLVTRSTELLIPDVIKSDLQAHDLDTIGKKSN